MIESLTHRILDALRSHGPTCADDLAAHLNAPRKQVWNALWLLRLRRRIEPGAVKVPRGKGGRPVTAWQHAKVPELEHQTAAHR